MFIGDVDDSLSDQQIRYCRGKLEKTILQHNKRVLTDWHRAVISV